MTSERPSGFNSVAGKIVRVFSRPGCHLCEVLIEDLLPVLRGVAEIEVVNIDEDAELQQRYGTRIPVVTIGDAVICEYFLDQAAVFAALEDQSGDS